MTRLRNVAVVLAGGTGTRVGLAIPKQLIKIAGKGMRQARFADACLFVDVTSNVRFGLEYAWYGQESSDPKSTDPKKRNVQSENHRSQLSAFYIF